MTWTPCLRQFLSGIYKKEMETKVTMRDEYVNKAVKLYLIGTIIITFIGRVVPIKLLIGDTIESYLYIALAMVGCVLLCVDFFITHKWRQGKYIIVLYAFVAVMLVSSVLNMSYGYVDNLKTIVWTVIQFGLFYTFYTRYDKDELIRFVDKIWQYICVFWFFPVVYSIGQFVVQDRYRVIVDGDRNIRQGFYDHRLFGIFQDPNYAAITSLYVVIACSYLYSKSKNKNYRQFLVVNIVVQIIYTVLSGSRTAMVSMIVGMIVWMFIKWVQNKENQKLWKNIRNLVAIPVVSVLSIVLLFGVVRKTSIILPISYRYITNQEIGDDDFSSNQDDELDYDLTEREDGKEGNISNNRGHIWAEYLKGLKGDYIFGGSPRNVLMKWQDKDPEGYLSLTSYETHNGYIFVLVGTGVLGLMCIVTYVILYGRKIVLWLKNKAEIDREITFIVTFLIVILTYVFFFTELFFIHNLTATLFWLHCGMAMHWLDKKGR